MSRRRRGAGTAIEKIGRDAVGNPHRGLPDRILRQKDGDIDFTVLEAWAPNMAPGGVGTGAMWGDGDLKYDIAVSGNAFVQTGGDAGSVTGAFFGSGHEGMGGVLERNDLAAGFGGTR